MRLKTILYVTGLSIVMVGFQNCAKTSFKDSGGAGDGQVAKASSLVAVEDAEVDNEVEIDDSGMDAEPDVTVRDDDMGPKKDRSEDRSDVDAPTDHANDLVVCILEGPGKSIKLGLIEDDLSGVHAVSKAICVSRQTCLVEVAKKFNVKSAEKRGYCKRHADDRVLSDSEVQELLENML